MKSRWVFKLGVVLSLGWLAWSAQFGGFAVAANVSDTLTATVVDVRSQQSLLPPEVLPKLARAHVVYLGETHDSAADHQAQFAIIQSLYQLNPKIVIGMEMFQRPFQSVLDDYLAGKIPETDLIERTQYKKRWGYPWEFYAPIVRFAQQKQLPVVALNTPSEVSRRVARTGLDSLTLADLRFIPPRSAIMVEPDTYRQRIRQIYDEMHHGKGNSSSFERFFQVQVLWDETMAERIAQILQQRPGVLVVVLVGQGHLLYGEGIPQRVARRRFAQPDLQQQSVLLNPTDEIRTATAGTIADYFWYSQDLPSPPKP
jgi:uncharacterized iron-regulated protein